jgi:hypothetical protein
MEVITMKISLSKVAQIFLLTALLIIGGALTGNTAEAAKFQINNLSGLDIYYIYISENDSQNWDSDLLGNSALKNGNSWSVNIPSNSSGYVKIKLVFQGGNDYTWRSVNIFENAQMTISRGSDGGMYAFYGKR